MTGAKLTVAGTIVAAIIGATATITAAFVQQKNTVPTLTTLTPVLRADGANTPTESTPPSTQTATTTTSTKPSGGNAPSASTPSSTLTATNATPAMPDGVTYQCTGSAPAGVDITYGPSASGLQATRLPFVAHDSVSQTALYYSITAQLRGGGDVTCTLTVTAAGHATTSSGAARGGYNIAAPQICANFQRRWQACG